jgi:hypothetical protein
MNTRELIVRFAAGPDKLESRLRGLTPEQLHYRPFPDAWTVHEQVVHLADAELNTSVRLRKILAESGVTVELMDEEKWFAGLDYRSQSLDRSVRLFRLLREISCDLLSRVREPMWEGNWVQHPERGKLTLRDLVEIYAKHADTHIEYIDRNLRLWGQKGDKP